MHVHFKTHGSGKNLFGDGFVVWYARDRLQLGKDFVICFSCHHSQRQHSLVGLVVIYLCRGPSLEPFVRT